MKAFKFYEKYVPYLYFLMIIPYWFTIVNKTEGITAYPIFLLAIPFIWQLLKPSRMINFYLGLTFTCSSAYLIIMYLFDNLNLVEVNTTIDNILLFSGVMIVTNFFMSLWIIKSSLNPEF
ncbi:hypothetical protein Q2T40_14170 [Winogradskyella maritima]|uniref:Uncharacterized protein n=1 Tax=Winogradskyella maritima TaxID=1517766 RepID=A0ABV8AH83_9FLAO|nr:hypothetical protein [Winogradskyella maritima]